MSVRRALLASILASGFATSAHAQCEARFTLVNHSGEKIQEFYFGPSTQYWGADQLSPNVVADGVSMSFLARVAGANDFKVVWASGRSAQLRGVNICETSQIVALRSAIIAR
jgi:hypothetical protein